MSKLPQWYDLKEIVCRGVLIVVSEVVGKVKLLTGGHSGSFTGF
jgi:hypothetical protein